MIASVPAVLLYKYLEKRDWITSAKGGIFLTVILFLAQLGLIELIAALKPDYTTGFLDGLLIDIGLFAGALFAFQKYFKSYIIKRPVVFYILLKVITAILVFLIIGMAFSFIALSSTQALIGL